MTTFGNTAGDGNAGVDLDDYIYGGYFQMGAIGGTGDSITAFLLINGDHKVKCALYNADNTLLLNGTTEEKTVLDNLPNPANTTFNFGVTKPILVANAWYWIAAWSEDAGGVAQLYKLAAGGSGIQRDSQVYGAWPDPWENIYYYGPVALASIYCTYTPTFKFNTMVGDATGWTWRKPIINVDKARRSTTNGLTWEWSVVTNSADYKIPSGSATGWTWLTENS
jgi:hypothetical protein